MRASEHAQQTQYLRRLARETARERLRRAREAVRDARAAKRGAVARARALCAAAREALKGYVVAERARVQAEIARLRAELKANIAARRADVRKCCGPDRKEVRATADARIAATRAELAQLLAERKREGIWGKPSPKQSKFALSAAERRAESDHEVEANLSDDELVVWRAVKDRIKATGRMSRTEAFQHWVHDHSADVARIMAADADRAYREAVKQEAEARAVIRQVPRAKESRLRQFLSTGLDVLGVAGLPLVSPAAAVTGVLARKARKGSKAPRVKARDLRNRRTKEPAFRGPLPSSMSIIGGELVHAGDVVAPQYALRNAQGAGAVSHEDLTVHGFTHDRLLLRDKYGRVFEAEPQHTKLSRKLKGHHVRPTSEVDAFARKVQKLIHTSPAVKSWHDRVYIASVYDAGKWPFSYAQFQSKLVEAHRAGALVLTRADLVGAMDLDMVERSTTTYLGAEWHFITPDPTKLEPAKRKKAAPAQPSKVRRGADKLVGLRMTAKQVAALRAIRAGGSRVSVNAFGKQWGKMQSAGYIDASDLHDVQLTSKALRYLAELDEEPPVPF